MEHDHVGVLVGVALVEVPSLGLEEDAFQKFSIVHVPYALEFVCLLLFLNIE